MGIFLVSLLIVIGQAQESTKTPAEIAQALLDSLDSDSRTLVNLSFDSPKWQQWTSSPLDDNPHHGMLFGDMNKIQLSLAFRLIKTALSERGYKKVLSIIAAEDASENDLERSSGKFFMTIFGTPSENKLWGWQVDGHHLSLNVVLVGNKISITPNFMGIEPAEYVGGSTIFRPLGREQDRAAALMESLSIEQKKAAMLDPSVRDILTGPGKDNFVPDLAGIPASELTAEQKIMLLNLIGEWVNNLKNPFAVDKMAEIQENLANTYFAWSGIAIHGGVVYYRIQGPSLLIEFGYEVDMGTVGQANHIHSIFRDPTNDYGAGMSP